MDNIKICVRIKKCVSIFFTKQIRRFMRNEKEFNKVISVLNKKNWDLEYVMDLKSGKEANLYLVRQKRDLFALKIYKPNFLVSSQDRYTAGKHFREKSFRRAVKKRTKFGKQIIKRLWTKREFYMIRKFYESGAEVPQVFDFTDEAILMEFIGDKQIHAPRLIDIKLEKKLASLIFKKIIASMKIFLENGVVHGDLSEFNILLWNSKPYIIDFPQSIDIHRNPNAKEILLRDLNNVIKYFSKYFEIDSQKLINEFLILLELSL